METKKVFSAFILLTLILFKVSSFHVYEHQGDKLQVEDCELCEYAIQNQNTDFSVPDVTSLPDLIDLPVSEVRLQNFDKVEISSSFRTFQLTRPPPSL